MSARYTQTCVLGSMALIALACCSSMPSQSIGRCCAHAARPLLQSIETTPHFARKLASISPEKLHGWTMVLAARSQAGVQRGRRCAGSRAAAAVPAASAASATSSRPIE